MDDPDPRSRRGATMHALSLVDAARAGAWSRELRERLSEPRGDVSLSLAMRELGAVHRGEQARLLCSAARLRCEAPPIGRWFLELRARTVPRGFTQRRLLLTARGLTRLRTSVLCV
jgi:hypothetical protein